MLAAAKIGAIWSSCSPDLGVSSVLDRFGQIAPRMLITVDAYRYGQDVIQLDDRNRKIANDLPTVETVVVVPLLSTVASSRISGDWILWSTLEAESETVEGYEAVPFNHPLAILFSSGTTGKPKAIVHSHGGLLLEHLKSLGLHMDLSVGRRFFWNTTTGWMMWNYLIAGLLVGATVVLFDGKPMYPDIDRLWRIVEDERISDFGVSATFLVACMRAGLNPRRDIDLSSLIAIGSTGSPLPTEGYAWVYDAVASDVILSSGSGGTDVCTAFVYHAPILPVYAGEITCRSLGAKVEAFDSDGRSVINEQGELVITAPMPSMPVFLWNDENGEKYFEAYFSYFPEVWRHGDWITITERGSCVISGRSDSTINRSGVRMGTAEFYRVLDRNSAVTDALVAPQEGPAGDPGRIVLFVVLAPDHSLSDELKEQIAAELRTELSPRHIPDVICEVDDIPRTLTGKKVEVPVKRLLMGEPLHEVVSLGALENPDALRRIATLVSANEIGD